MKRISSFILLLALSMANGGWSKAWAQKVEIAVENNWAEIPVQQTQSELKPGWKIVDYQTKSRLMHYLSGGHATQLADANRPVFRVTPGEKEVLFDYALIRLKGFKSYRKIPKVQLSDNEYTRLELNAFSIKADGDAFICQPLQPLSPGEYILANLSQKPIGDLSDLLVYPFCVLKD